jgi:type I restriction enzyme S subunit
LGRGATFKEISKQIVSNIEINVPDEDTQIKAVENLEKLSDIIKLRKEELATFDELIKARFVELFGDPKLNPKKWDVVNISEVVGGKVSNGFFAKRDDYCDDGNIRVLGVANIVNRMYSNLEDLPRTNADDKDIEKFEVKYGDMLFCRSSLVAEGIGKASIIPEDVQENILFECHVIRLPLDLSKCVPEFMQTLSTMDYFRNQVISQSKTATMTTIGQDGILKTDIILPPIDKQKEFYDFVKKVDKSKVAVQKSLDETRKLFDSLMQEYFG